MPYDYAQTPEQNYRGPFDVLNVITDMLLYSGITDLEDALRLSGDTEDTAIIDFQGELI